MEHHQSRVDWLFPKNSLSMGSLCIPMVGRVSWRILHSEQQRKEYTMEPPKYHQVDSNLPLNGAEVCGFGSDSPQGVGRWKRCVQCGLLQSYLKDRHICEYLVFVIIFLFISKGFPLQNNAQRLHPNNYIMSDWTTLKSEIATLRKAL